VGKGVRGAEAETPKALRPRGCGMGRWFSPLKPTSRSGERRELPQQNPEQSPGRKRISVLSKRHRMPVVEMFVVNQRPVSLFLEKP